MIDINLNQDPLPQAPEPGELVQLRAAHLSSVLEFLQNAPIENVALIERLLNDGLPGPPYQEFVGYRIGQAWRGILHFGGDMFVYAPDERAVAPLARYALRRIPLVPRIFGRTETVARFWAVYASLPHTVQFDRQQVLYTLSRGDNPVTAPGQIRPAQPEQCREVAELAAAMSQEEIQIDPLEMHGTSYLRLVERRIEEGRYWVITEGGKIRFQLTINALLPEVGQITGVYTHPQFRGQGYAKRGMGDFARIALQATQMLSLFVNDFNTPAIRVYESLGFKPSGSFRVIYLEE